MMNTNIKKIKKAGFFAVYVIIVLLTTTMCEEDPRVWDKKSDELQISNYLIQESDKYSEFFKAIEKSDLDHLLKTRGPYTLFVPNNEAMFAYYEKHGYDSLGSIDPNELKILVMNHLIGLQIMSTDIGLGSLSYPNAISDYLVTDFKGPDILVNKESIIVDRDILCANGVIHEIDMPIEVVKNTIYGILKDDPEYSIFTRGLEETGISDTLDIIEIPYGQIQARTRYTILAVPDSVYAKDGINSYEELLATYDDGNGLLTDINNGFYKYMDYHCLEGVYYLSTFTSGIYYTLSRENQVNFEISDDYKINIDKETKEYTSFIVEESNLPAKNGTIHAINGQLPDIDPQPISYTFRVTDYPDVRELDSYMSYITFFTDGENDFAKIKWNADYLQYYFKSGVLVNNWDGIVMSDGYWWVEITVPKIRKGKYQIVGGFREGSNRANVIAYIDDQKVDNIIELYATGGYTNVERTVIEEIEWTETTEHKFKLVTITPGIIFWVFLRFEPI